MIFQLCGNFQKENFSYEGFCGEGCEDKNGFVMIKYSKGGSWWEILGIEKISIRQKWQLRDIQRYYNVFQV